MNNKPFCLFVYLIIFVFSTLGFLCNGGNEQPAITIRAVDCPAENILITATATRNNATNNWIVTVRVNVKCNGQNIPNAEIKIKYLGSDYKANTDASGDVSRPFPPATGDPVGNTVKVTVMGTGDAETKVDIVVTAN
jgi:hypothetical protein